ncbi:hypothetical protein KW507_15695 [Vibrio fluvialis]|nr:hypothetical protein [Vibrio fluvialis]
MTPRVSFGAGQTGRLTSHVDWALAGLFGERVIGWFVITKTRKGEAMFVCVYVSPAVVQRLLIILLYCVLPFLG